MKRVLCIPCGRPACLEIFSRYIQRDRHLFDECQLWVNCPEESIGYLEDWADTDPDFYKLIYLPQPLIPTTDSEHLMANVRQFLLLCQDPDTHYIKADDDTVFVERGTFEAIFDRLESDPEPFQVICNTVNNAACSHFHSRRALKGMWLILSGTGSALVHHGHMGERVHETFLRLYAEGNLDGFRFGGFQPPIIPVFLDWNYGIRWPNQVYGFRGVDYRELAEPVLHKYGDEEWSLTVEVPRLTGRPVVYLGDRLTVHYAYKGQEKTLMAREDLLASYREIAEKECGL